MRMDSGYNSTIQKGTTEKLTEWTQLSDGRLEIVFNDGYKTIGPVPLGFTNEEYALIKEREYFSSKRNIRQAFIQRQVEIDKCEPLPPEGYAPTDFTSRTTQIADDIGWENPPTTPQKEANKITPESLDELFNKANVPPEIRIENVGILPETTNAILNFDRTTPNEIVNRFLELGNKMPEELTVSELGFIDIIDSLPFSNTLVEIANPYIGYRGITPDMVSWDIIDGGLNKDEAKRIYRNQVLPEIERTIKETIKIPLKQETYDGLARQIANTSPSSFKNSDIPSLMNMGQMLAAAMKLLCMITDEKGEVNKRQQTIREQTAASVMQNGAGAAGSPMNLGKALGSAMSGVDGALKGVMGSVAQAAGVATGALGQMVQNISGLSSLAGLGQALGSGLGSITSGISAITNTIGGVANLGNALGGLVQSATGAISGAIGGAVTGAIGNLLTNTVSNTGLGSILSGAMQVAGNVQNLMGTVAPILQTIGTLQSAIGIGQFTANQWMSMVNQGLVRGTENFATNLTRGGKYGMTTGDPIMDNRLLAMRMNYESSLSGVANLMAQNTRILQTNDVRDLSIAHRYGPDLTKKMLDYDQTRFARDFFVSTNKMHLVSDEWATFHNNDGSLKTITQFRGRF